LLRSGYDWLVEQELYRERLGREVLAMQSTGQKSAPSKNGRPRLAAPELEEVTRVEVNPFAEGTGPPDPPSGDWVIGDSTALRLQAAPPPEDSPTTGTVVIPPLDNAPVVGELEVVRPRPELSEPLKEVAAVMAPLGSSERSETPEEIPTQILALDGSERGAGTGSENPEDLLSTGVRPPRAGTSRAATESGDES
jgi:hypothetical protein